MPQKSGGGPPQPKTLREIGPARHSRERLEYGGSSTAFERAKVFLGALAGRASESGGGPPHSKTLRETGGAGHSLRRVECGAFTLIEMMISSALMALILVSAYLCLGAGFSAQKLIEPRAEIIQNARVALALMSADLRAACPLSKTDDFLGMTRTMGNVEADNVDFATHNYTPRRAREGDFCQESLYLDQNPETGQFSLWRRRNPAIGLDALAGGIKEEIAQGVVSLKFEYFDGVDWYDSWGNVDPKKTRQSSAREQSNLTGLPEAVRITLLLDSNPKKKQPNTASGEEQPERPFVFETMVRLNLADVVQSAENASSSADTTASPDQTPGNSGNNN